MVQAATSLFCTHTLTHWHSFIHSLTQTHTDIYSHAHMLTGHVTGPDGSCDPGGWTSESSVLISLWVKFDVFYWISFYVFKWMWRCKLVSTVIITALLTHCAGLVNGSLLVPEIFNQEVQRNDFPLNVLLELQKLNLTCKIFRNICEHCVSDDAGLSWMKKKSLFLVLLLFCLMKTWSVGTNVHVNMKYVLCSFWSFFWR